MGDFESRERTNKDLSTMASCLFGRYISFKESSVLNFYGQGLRVVCRLQPYPDLPSCNYPSSIVIEVRARTIRICRTDLS